MTDSFGRNITYLRVSLTELCNLRCRYCMPEDGICKKMHEQMLTAEETVMAVKAAASLGVNKVRLTGGEPLVKKSVLSISEQISEIDGIDELCLTTNGTYLSDMAKPLREAGIDRINISIDTLNAEKYRYITRCGNLDDTLRGIESALDAGFSKVKLNTVLIGGFNDDEIEDLARLTEKWDVDVRFIELMPMYDSGDFGPEAFIPYSTVLERLPQLEKSEDDGGVAKLYHLPGAKGNVGLISPISSHFCDTCNRLRLTCDGLIRPCLHSDSGFSVKGLSYDEMRTVFEQAIASKPKWHGRLDYEARSRAGRNMNEIGG